MVSSASLVRPSSGSAPSADTSEPHLGTVPAAVSWEPEPAGKRESIPFGHGSSGKGLHLDSGCSSLSVHECLIFHRISDLSTCAICHCSYWRVSECVDFLPVFLCSCVHGLCFGGQWLVQWILHTPGTAAGHSQLPDK